MIQQCLQISSHLETILTDPVSFTTQACSLSLLRHGWSKQTTTQVKVFAQVLINRDFALVDLVDNDDGDDVGDDGDDDGGAPKKIPRPG